MRPELERLQLIEQQILNTPSALPAEDWTVRLLVDGELAADAETQQQLYHGLRLAGRQQLRQELRQIHAQLYGGWRAWLRRIWPM
ncbi:hypothetical protein KB206_16270 [Microvirga sp. STS02]|uniref:hypothetical protein n=1 Tax=Hymenobacter negativus TaxID=2795026 RepID=UPI0018DDCA72|nr:MULTISPECIES: hypothetical protein [Bacteria]MBH8570450.1 hypothetical protein [Hymenobacter negativus]MBR7210189.1 hypothetical protein [Microvirga sp. STS02]